MSNRQLIGIIGGLGNEAMVDLAGKIGRVPGHERHSYIFFGNSRLALKPHEVDKKWGPQDEPELRRWDTARHTARVMHYLGCGVVGLACNSAHEVFRSVMDRVPVTFVDMIRETAASMQDETGKVLVMGVSSLVESGLYQTALAEQGVSATSPSAANRQKTMSAIYDPEFGIKTAKITSRAEELLCEVIREEHERQGCTRVVLGCTELPLALTEESCARFRQEGMIPDAVSVVDASAVLARCLVEAESTPSREASPAGIIPRMYTDWFPPALFLVDTLDELIRIQEEVFRLTARFLSDRGKSITGSYMHLPTLFIVGDVPGIEERLVPLPQHRIDGSLDEALPRILEDHFNSMK